MKSIITVLFVFVALLSYSQELKPTATKALLNIYVTDYKDAPSGGGDVISFEGVNNKLSFKETTNEKGSFSILIPKGDTYKVKIQGMGDIEDYTSITIPDTSALVNFDFIIKYEMPKVYTLKNVFFDVNKATLRPESYKELNNLLAVMKNKSSMKIEISGHTDSDGDDAHNKTLSQNRANAVKNYLVKNGIESSRIIAVGYGEEKPIAPNDTPENKQKNRRTEVHILN